MIQHRIRTKDGKTKIVKLSPLRSIRYFCIECMGFSALEVKQCTDKLCTKYPYRLGRNTERKGLGGDIGKMALKKKQVSRDL